MSTVLDLHLCVALLAHPTNESLAALADWADDAPWLDDPRRELAKISLAEWQAEHTRLFINGQPQTACPPFASVYLHGQMYGPVTEAAFAFYQSLGITPNADVPADYLGTLLECAIYLIDSDQRDSPAWRVLWSEYLDTWIADFATDLQREAQLLLYRALGAKIIRTISNLDNFSQ